MAHRRAYTDTPTAFDVLPALLRLWLHSSRDQPNAGLGNPRTVLCTKQVLLIYAYIND